MRKQLNALSDFLGLLLRTLRSLLTVALYSSFSAHRRIRAIAKTNAARRCLVLGNGPSLNDFLAAHDNHFPDLDLVAVNLFCTTPAFRTLRPRHYVLRDPGFFTKTDDERLNRIQRDFFEHLRHVDWPMNLFVPGDEKMNNIPQDITANPNIRFLKYNATNVLGLPSVSHCLYRHDLGMPRPVNVLCAAICLMINLDYREIYLAGADHSWLKDFSIDDENNLILHDKHFYGNENINRIGGLDRWLLTQYTCFNSHVRIRQYADSRQAKVYNATQGSLIDAYERKQI